MKDLYEILGLTNKATAEDIKKSYRNLAKKYHPDVVGNDEIMNLQFQEIKEAYKILDNVEKRKGYDAMQSRLNQLEEDSQIETDNKANTDVDEKVMQSCKTSNIKQSINRNQKKNNLFSKLRRFFQN